MFNIKTVADIGAAHLGNLDSAKQLAKLAIDAGCDFVKFQKRNPKECVPLDIQNLTHPNPEFAHGETYLEHRENLELTIKQHAELKKYCEILGGNYACSVFDLTSAQEIIKLKPDYIKVPSACNENYELLNYIYYNFEGNVHISTGMLSRVG